MAVQRNFERRRVFLQCFNRRDGVAIFHAAGAAAKEPCSFLNITLAQILGDAQLTKFGTDLRALRLHPWHSAAKPAPAQMRAFPLVFETQQTHASR